MEKHVSIIGSKIKKLRWKFMDRLALRKCLRLQINWKNFKRERFSLCRNKLTFSIASTVAEESLKNYWMFCMEGKTREKLRKRKTPQI